MLTRVILFSMLILLGVGCSKETSTSDTVKAHRGEKVNKDEFPAVANTIYGAWRGPNVSNNPSAELIPMIYVAQNNRVSMSMMCVLPQRSPMYVTFKLDGRLTGNRLEIPNTMEQTFADGNDRCSARIERGTLVLENQREQLRMVNPDKASDSITFDRQ